MISPNGVYTPVKAMILRGGKYTKFGIQQFHKEYEREVIDGYINLIVHGTYDFNLGDKVKVLEITGATISHYNGRTFFTLYCNIEYISREEIKAKPNKTLIEENIPDDL